MTRRSLHIEVVGDKTRKVGKTNMKDLEYHLNLLFLL